MNKDVTEKKENRCLILINQGAPFKAVHEHAKKLNGFYNGIGWLIENKHKEAASQICENASVRCIEFPILESFETLRKQNHASYYAEKLFKNRLEIDRLKDSLTIPRELEVDDLSEELRKQLEQIPEGRKLLDLIDEYDTLQKQVKRVEEEEKLAKLHLDASGGFKYLLEPISEEQIAKEINDTSPGISVGFKIGDIDLKIPGGAVSIIAAPTSHGKTTQLINFSLGALNYPGQEDKSIYFFSYEESRAAIVSLFLNTYIGEKLSSNNRESIKSFFRYGDMRFHSSEGNSRVVFPKKKDEFFNTLIKKGRLNIFYSEFSAQELVAAIKFLKKNTNVGLICVDYMQLLKLSSTTFGGSRQEELKQVCLLLKDCAVETGLPILLAAQFSRQVTCEADLSPIYISEAGDIERVANMIIGFWNRNFEGFTSEGNRSKSKKLIPKESAIYMEILKGRETGAGHSEVFDFDGNSGKLKQREKSTTHIQPKMNGPKGHSYD
jgi:replicative DNA helicase